MKEQTYSWYPSAKDVYKDRRMGAPSTYHIKAMYNFDNSKYYCEQTTPPTPLLQVVSPSPIPTLIPASCPKSVASSRGGSAASLQVWAKSVPMYDYKPTRRLQIPTPRQCWTTKLDETSYDLVQPIPATATSQPPISPVASLARSSPNKRGRVRSAMICRDRPPPPSRPMKSAGPTRHRAPFAKTAGPRTPAEIARSPIDIRPTSSPAALTRRPPPKEVPVLQPADIATYEDLPEDRSPILEEDKMYEHLLQKYGCRAQIHGDPLKLKCNIIPKRCPFTVQVQEPEIDPKPPKVHMESKDTFFLNTIPRRQMTFTIHREWISETIHAKRMDLQKREGIKYRYKNFSFVY